MKGDLTFVFKLFKTFGEKMRSEETELVILKILRSLQKYFLQNYYFITNKSKLNTIMLFSVCVLN